MRFWTHDRHDFPLPGGHKFPLGKYRMLRERLVADGIAAAGDIHGSTPCPWERLAEAHQAAYLERVREGRLSDREIRVLGLPWSTELVERGRRSAQGTLEAARDALVFGHGMNLGGGTHHAGRAAGRGYCLFNDLAVSIAALRGERTLGRVAIVDCDVHQGDGTAELLHPDPDVFTCSVHGGANYPFRRATSDLDIDLPTGTGDDDYLEALTGALDTIDRWDTPELVFYLAGADPWEGDRLGRLSLTKHGLAARDALVMDRAESWGAAICVVLAGGYAPDLADTVDINVATARALVARAG
ncbi:MAG: histone deacetylase [Solirubrobacteraceae bacterium]|nr:histone deacetylase [Patulibacter sp.]